MVPHQPSDTSRTDPSPRNLPIVAMGATVAFCLLGDSMLYAVLPTRMDELTLTAVQVGWLLSINRFVRLFTNPLAASLFERFQFKSLFSMAVLLSVLSTASYGYTGSFAWLLGTRVCWGFCWSILRLAGYLAILSPEGPPQHGKAMGLFVQVYRSGMLAGLLLGGPLTDLLGYRNTALFLAGLTILGFSTLRHWPSVGRSKRSEKTPSALNALIHPPHLLLNFTALGASTIVAGLVGATAGYCLKQNFGDLHMRLGTLRLSITTLTAALLSSQHAYSLLLAPSLGRLTDRLNASRAGQLGLGLLLVGSATLLLAPGLTWILVSHLIVFLGGSLLSIALPVEIGRAATAPNRSYALAAQATWSDLGAAAGPILGYFLAERLGLLWGYGLAMGLAALLILLRATRKSSATLHRGKGERNVV